MITVRHAADRGRTNHGWLDSRHTFSFGDYYDPQQLGFRSLRVINEDRVNPKSGFPTHAHRDMEILSVVLAGALKHRDSTGQHGLLKASDVQLIHAGTGIEHSEFNASKTESVHFLQIWIRPDHPGHTPGYAQASFAAAPADRLQLIVSPDGRDGSLPIHQDAAVYLARLNPGRQLKQPVPPTRHAWVQVAAGTLDLNGHPLGPGDGAAITDDFALTFTATAASPAQFLLFDLV
jgi:quercetin 2,3-dioxygenase